jgi:hypothetical protein
MKFSLPDVAPSSDAISMSNLRGRGLVSLSNQVLLGCYSKFVG